MADRAENPTPPPERTATVLGVSPLPADRLLLRGFLPQRSCKLHQSTACHGALTLVRQHSVPMLLSDHDRAEVPASETVAPCMWMTKSFVLTAMLDRCKISSQEELPHSGAKRMV
jgi:hypothetical protein